MVPRAVGICGSDYHIFTGHWKIKPPLILGHEFTGEVVETGPGADRFKPGDHVVIEPAVTCGKCYYCNSIDTNNYFCEDRPTVGFTQNGAFADFVIVPEKELHSLPDNLDFEKELWSSRLHALYGGRTGLKCSPVTMLSCWERARSACF